MKQHFNRQASACEKALEVLHKAVEIDPDNAIEYQDGIIYTSNILKCSKAIVKAYEITEPAKKESEDSAKSDAGNTEPEKPKARKRKAKPKSKDNHFPVSTPTEKAPDPAPEAKGTGDEALFSIFGD